ncbi:YMGG-like Gly-zipper [Chryseobacterium wanjuense]|uniref:YMGG-like Gly-zipper n=1 Tax=Chryseobacterium wanjuense TaxID=356305 RepID=A0A1I0MQR5_9FLAO|nr:YMGG-like glycine zipper-containing protein [Chryseobacterium wanjuense]SEV90499.1 YMGG-like Gly-zipper [Chryseobacterium wanjuense]
MKSIVLTGLLSVFLLTACKKDDQVAEKSLEQQKVEFQMRQLEIEKQKLAIEKEKMAYEAQKKADSTVEAQKAKTAAANNSRPEVIRETHTVYRDRPSQSSGNGTYANNGSSASQGTTTTQKKGMSKAAKGTIIGTVGGAAAGAIIAKKNRGLGAVIGGVIGGATGYTIGRAGDRKDGRVQPR